MARKVDVDIGVKNKMAAGLKSAKAAMMRFGKSAGRILKGVAVATVALGTAIVALGVKSLKSFAVQEAAERSLVEAMKAHGDAVDELLPKHKALASAIQDETGAADESTLALMAKLRTLGVTNDEMEKAVKLTMALGKVGMREKTAFRAAASAIQGNTSTLTEYIPELRNAKTETEKLAIVNDMAVRGYKQLSGEIDTNAGRWREMKGRIGDVLERIGKAISGGKSLKDTLAALSNRIKSFGNSPKFDAFLEKVDAATQGVLRLFKEMASGNAGSVMSKVADVIVAAFGVAGERVVGLLKAAAPEIGKLITGGMKRAVIGDKDARIRAGRAREAVSEQLKQEDRDRGDRIGKQRSRIGYSGFRKLVDEHVANQVRMAAAEEKRILGTKGLTAAEAELKNKMDILKDVIPSSAVPSRASFGLGGGIVKTGGASPNVLGGAGVGAISANTSMMSTSDLFTMMQTGGAAKKDAELTALQGIEKGVQELVKVAGGPE